VIARPLKVIAPLAFLIVALAGPAAAKIGVPSTFGAVVHQNADALQLVSEKKKKKPAAENGQSDEKTADKADKKKKKKAKKKDKNKKDKA
jgi:hypothetical protein